MIARLDHAEHAALLQVAASYTLGVLLPVAAMRWANRAAGVVVGKLGTATCTLEELRD